MHQARKRRTLRDKTFLVCLFNNGAAGFAFAPTSTKAITLEHHLSCALCALWRWDCAHEIDPVASARASSTSPMTQSPPTSTPQPARAVSPYSPADVCDQKILHTHDDGLLCIIWVKCIFDQISFESVWRCSACRKSGIVGEQKGYGKIKLNK